MFSSTKMSISIGHRHIHPRFQDEETQSVHTSITLLAKEHGRAAQSHAGRLAQDTYLRNTQASTPTRARYTIGQLWSQ